jgi:hypothetical protein
MMHLKFNRHRSICIFPSILFYIIPYSILFYGNHLFGFGNVVFGGNFSPGAPYMCGLFGALVHLVQHAVANGWLKMMIWWWKKRRDGEISHEEQREDKDEPLLEAAQKKEE